MCTWNCTLKKKKQTSNQNGMRSKQKNQIKNIFQKKKIHKFSAIYILWALSINILFVVKNHHLFFLVFFHCQKRFNKFFLKIFSNRIGPFVFSESVNEVPSQNKSKIKNSNQAWLPCGFIHLASIMCLCISVGGLSAFLPIMIMQ